VQEEDGIREHTEAVAESWEEGGEGACGGGANRSRRETWGRWRGSGRAKGGDAPAEEVDCGEGGRRATGRSTEE
jgi:hypothetical protein